MNGWITIGSKLDTKQLEKDIKSAEKELAQYEKEGEKLTSIQGKNYDNLQPYLEKKKAIEDEINLIQSSNKAEIEKNTLINYEKGQLHSVYLEYEQQIKAYNEIARKIRENNSKQKEAKKEVEELNDKLRNVQAYDKVKGKIGEIGSALKNVATKGDLKGISTKIQGVGNTIKGITGKVIKWGLALFGIRTAYNFIRQSASTVFQQNEGLANQVQLMKNAIATALEPLIRNLVSLAYTLFSFINGIVKGLTGKDLFAQASKNLSSGASSAKEINKQLAGFDEMNVLTDSSSGGGAGGGMDTSGFVEENTKLKQLLEEFKKMFEEGDWAGIAQKISSGIVSGLDFLYHKIMSIDWKGIGSAISEFLTNIDFSGIFVGLVKVFGEAVIGLQNLLLAIDWATIAKNFGDGLVDALDMMIQYVHRMDFSAMGKKISDTWTSIPWGEIGSSIINLLWEGIKGIVDLVLAIDWSEVGQTLSDTIHEWINTLVDIFINTDWKQLGKDIVDAIFDFIEGVDWLQLGTDIILGLGEGLLATLDLIVGIFEELINKVLELFGIHSPSTVFSDMGKNIMEGLFNGISSLVNSVVGIFSNIWTNIKEIFSGVGTWFKNKFTEAWTNIKNIFNNLKTFFSNIWNNIKIIFGNIGTNIGNAIGGAFKAVVNGVLSTAENVLNSPIRTINSMIGAINKLPGVNIGRLSTFNLPRLAQGGIINQPGRGVMVGSAVAGERGREGVIPLTDSQQMAILGEAIGKYITINASITNTMNGRVISRELQKINNENDFAFNR